MIVSMMTRGAAAALALAAGAGWAGPAAADNFRVYFDGGLGPQVFEDINDPVAIPEGTCRLHLEVGGYHWLVGQGVGNGNPNPQVPPSSSTDEIEIKMPFSGCPQVPAITAFDDVVYEWLGTYIGIAASGSIDFLDEYGTPVRGPGAGSCQPDCIIDDDFNAEPKPIHEAVGTISWLAADLDVVLEELIFPADAATRRRQLDGVEARHNELGRAAQRLAAALDRADQAPDGAYDLRLAAAHADLARHAFDLCGRLIGRARSGVADDRLVEASEFLTRARRRCGDASRVISDLHLMTGEQLLASRKAGS